MTSWSGLPDAVAAKAAALKPYVPHELAASVLLHANENYAAPLVDWAAVADRVALNRYPDPTAARCCALAAQLFGVAAEQVVAGNGSDELIALILLAALPKSARIVVTQPDFDMYATYARQAELSVVPLAKDGSLQVDVEALIAAAQTADALLLSNPCNPTGQGLTREQLHRLLTSTTALCVIDEAYMDFWDQSLIGALNDYPNLMILKTCSKAFGMAGIRLGFALASKLWIDLIKAVKSPFNVNALTQAVAEQVLSAPQQLHDMTAAVLASKTALLDDVRALLTRLTLLDTHTNFLLLRGADAASLYGALAEGGIAVRYFAPDLLRVTVGSREENDAFVQALKRWEALV